MSKDSKSEMKVFRNLPSVLIPCSLFLVPLMPSVYH